MLDVCGRDEEIGNVLIPGWRTGGVISSGKGQSSRVFDSSHNISQILKFLPFYERLALRVVNSRWNLSFQFPGCWESLDYRFYDFKKHQFYLRNLKRFIVSTKRLDICIDQIYDLNKLISSVASEVFNSRCVRSKLDSNFDQVSNCSIETSDVIEIDSYCNSDDDSPECVTNDHDSDDSNLNVNNTAYSNSNEVDLLDSNSHINKFSKPDFNIEDVIFDLKNILLTLKNLNTLQISDRCNKYNNIFTRVSPIVLNFIESQNPYLNNSIVSDSKIKNLELNSCSEGITTLILDCPVDLNFILQLSPFLKNLKNLVISRIIEQESDFSVCSVVSELLEHIPKNQLESIQIGKTVPTFKSNNKVLFSSEARLRQVNRISLSSQLFNSCNDLEEGDELICTLLSNHSDSLKILILDDIDLSFSAYNKIKDFKFLKYVRVPVWSNLNDFFPPNFVI